MSDATGLIWGGPVGLGRNPGFSNSQIDASGKIVAWVFSMPEAAIITHAGFRYGGRTGTPPAYRISLQGLDASGQPDGTVLGGGTPASTTFTPPADATIDGLWQWKQLDNAYACARGDFITVVVDYSSGTINASNRSSFTTDAGSVSAAGIPYSLSNSGAAWTKQVGGIIAGVKSVSKSYGWPFQSITSNTVATSGQRLAMKFTPPAGWGTSFQVVGMRLNGRMATGATPTFGLWNVAGTALQSVTKDGDWNQSPSSNGRFLEVYFSDASLATLSEGTAYYLGMQADGTSVGLDTWGLASAAEMSALPGGAAFMYSTWNGSAWTDVTSSRPILEPILADLTVSGGSSGGFIIGG